MHKARLNDESLSRQQKLYSGSRFTSYRVYLPSCPWAQKLPHDIPVDAGLLCNKITVGNCLLYTCHLLIVFLTKCNTLYMPCWQILHHHFTRYNTMSSSAGKQIPILLRLKFVIFSTESSSIRWSGSSWSRLKHLVSYKIPCVWNKPAMRRGHQSPAYKPS